MADKVQATYDDLRSVASALDGLAARADAVYNNVSSNREALNGQWMGFGYNSFASEMDGEILPGLQKLANALRSASATTTQISTQFETVETEDGQKIRSISAPSTIK